MELMIGTGELNGMLIVTVNGLPTVDPPEKEMLV